MGVVRALLWLVTHTLYRMRVLGRENVPCQGGALLVCNRVTFLDWLLILAVQPRPVRFIVQTPHAHRWGVRHLLRWSGAIVLDGSGGPRSAVSALRAARTALAAGDLVCLFTGRMVARSGFSLSFAGALRRITRRRPVPIIPVSLDQAWGSYFAYRAGRLHWKPPQRWPSPAAIVFGAPLPPSTSAAEVCLAIQRLSAAWACRSDYRPVHREFLRMAARHPFRPCIFDPLRPKGLTYGRTLAGAMMLARWLRPVLREEPMVAIWLPPGIGAVIVNIALAFLGKTPVNLNYTAGPKGLRSALEECGIRHVITSTRFTKRMPLDPGPGVEVLILEDAAAQATTLQRYTALLKVLLLPGWVLDRFVLGLHRHRLDDLATVIFSSGSTGNPKGVMLTHRNIAANALSAIQVIHIRPDHRLLGVLPFFHSFGFTVTLWTALISGASVVYYPDPRASKEIGESSRVYRCNLFVFTPTFLRFCLKRCLPDDFITMKILICGAEKLPQALAQEFAAKFGVLPLEGYGCTELSPVVATNLPDQVIDGVRFVFNKTGSIGPPIPGVAVRVVDPEHPDQVLPAGCEGLLLVTGPNVMKGYLHRDDLTRQAIRDGWYVTGDIGRIDEDGYIFLTGRLSRFAKVGGEMIPLERIEEELHALLETNERLLAVTCVADEVRGERLVVLYTSLNGQAPHRLGKGLAEHGLPNLWVPAERDFYQVPELPILGSGKVNLQRLKEMAQERTNTKAVSNQQSAISDGGPLKADR
jgi:acyl-[acyl-carrier-protein]-phospholipid O-acyltransferase/long-chain-fatty-acid--[acyl-carrier-protein] ligase